MLGFLFWNLNRQPLTGLLAALARAEEVHVLLLAECDIRPVDLLRAINTGTGPTFTQVPPVLPTPGTRRFFGVTPYACLPSGAVNKLDEGNRWTISHIRPPIGPDVILAGVHLPSKLHQDDYDQEAACQRLVAAVHRIEDMLDHRRTIIMGDFNMNPFENGVVAANALHAISDRRIARKLTRTVAGQEYHYFYNPMWNHLGDALPGPPGTYFYSNGKQVDHYWHTFDQVLIRPELLDAFADDGLRIITEIGGQSLLKPSGIPDYSAGSDHLPIVLHLNL